MNILLIIFENEINNLNVFRDRINTLGDILYAFDNVVFVETECNAKEAYEKISTNEYAQNRILILYVMNEMLGFWGHMKTQLWNWLRDKEDNTQGGLYKSYMDEILKLHTKQMELEKELQKIIEVNTHLTRTVEFQHQQIQIMETQIKKKE